MDAFTEIGVFARVVAAQGFTAAAQQLGMTPSGVSRVVSRLEERLGVRLLNRTTRSLSLTDDGAAYFERCTRILSELADAEGALAQARRSPRGRLRVETAVVLGEHVIGPALPGFLQSYPDLAVDLMLRDQLVDPTAEGADVTVRLAELRDSELLARRLGHARRVLVAAPAYLARQGRPRDVADLRKHSCIGYLAGGAAMPWRFKGSGGELSFAITGRLHASSGRTLRQAALAGLGLVQVLEHHVAAELRTGALERVLMDHEPAPGPIYVLYAREKATLPKVRVFVEFLAKLFEPRARGGGRTA